LLSPHAPDAAAALRAIPHAPVAVVCAGFRSAADLGVDLDWHIQFVADALKARADSLGLAGT
jgi:hypothetical protein